VQSLTGPEIEHDRVGPTMHHTSPLRSQIAAGAPRARPTPPPPAAEPLVIESSAPRLFEDDDPTRVMSRPPMDAQTTLEQVGAMVASERAGDAARPAPRPGGTVTGPMIRDAGRPQVWMWMFILLVALAGGSAAAYYLLGQR
jgi:hypothetical protein